MPLLERVITERDSGGKILKYEYRVDGKAVPEGHRFCKACETILPLTSEYFAKNSHSCRECAKANARRWYLAHKDDESWLRKRNERVTQDGLEKKKRAIDFMGGKCQDCEGVFHPHVYDFHHLDPVEKEYNIGDIVRKKNFDTIQKELAKCVLLCANCHRIRHFEGGEK